MLSGNTTTHCYTTAGLVQHNYRHKMKHLNALVLSDLTQDYGDMLPQHTHTYTHTHTHLTAVFPGLPRWASTRKIKSIWIFLTQETVSGSGISWAICKSLASEKSRLILSYWYWLTWVVPEKRQLNGCVCACMYVCVVAACHHNLELSLKGPEHWDVSFYDDNYVVISQL